MTSGSSEQVLTTRKVRITTELGDELRRLLATGQKIQAIKRLREETGLGLAEAKSVVDQMEPAGSRGKAGCTGALVGWLMPR
ncbi:MAG: ribosomal protein L7/L12 [Armatimonadetes bacterium]|nr:ribosomal protein L7/L12 [Armatimonadota bacterium]